jgi:hypothetical protein
LAKDPAELNTGLTCAGAIICTDITATGNFTYGNAASDVLSVTGLLKVGTSGTNLTHTAGTPQFQVYTTNAGTSGSTSAEPVLVYTTLTGIGQVGGRARFFMTSNVALGGWSNALKGEVTYGASGRTTGLGSAICAEMTLSAGTTSGTYAPFEVELNLASGAKTGTQSSFMYFSVNGADKGTFDDFGFLFSLNGVTAGATHIFQTADVHAVSITHTLKCAIGGTAYYIPLSTSAAFDA